MQQKTERCSHRSILQYTLWKMWPKINTDIFWYWPISTPYVLSVRSAMKAWLLTVHCAVGINSQQISLIEKLLMSDNPPLRYRFRDFSSRPMVHEITPPPNRRRSEARPHRVVTQICIYHYFCPNREISTIGLTFSFAWWFDCWAFWHFLPFPPLKRAMSV